MPANQYVHLNSVYLYFPIKIEKSTTKTSNIDENMITVKNVFALWIREIEAKRYGDDLQIVSNLTAKVYRYSDVMLKHKPKGGLKTFENTLLFSRNLVFLKKYHRAGCRNHISCRVLYSIWTDKVELLKQIFGNCLAFQKTIQNWSAKVFTKEIIRISFRFKALHNRFWYCKLKIRLAWNFFSLWQKWPTHMIFDNYIDELAPTVLGKAQVENVTNTYR